MDRPLKISIAFGEADAEPRVIRDCVIRADELGFHGAWLADHFMPWAHSKSQSPFVWSLLASCLESTNKIALSPFVTTPVGGRYHPALIAQASSTLENMYPGRFRLAVGTGEAINEAHFPMGWPPFQERLDRLAEAISLVRKFWMSNDFFDFDGRFFPMKQVYLYTKPLRLPPIYLSSFGRKSSFYAGKFADHLVTLIGNLNDVQNTLQRCRDTIFPSFYAGAKAAGKDPSRMEKAVALSMTFQSQEKYLLSARNVANLYLKGVLDEPDPRKILTSDSSSVTNDELLAYTYFCSKWDDAIDVLEEIQEIGATEVVIFLGTDHKRMKGFSKKVLPHFRK